MAIKKTGQFKELNSIINKVMENISKNQRLLRLLYYTDEYNPFDNSLADVKYSNILMKNLFPLPKVPDAQTETKALLTVVIGDSARGKINSSFRTEFLHFGVIVHIDSWMIKGGLRALYILEELDNMFNGVYIPEVSMTDVLFEVSKPNKFSDNFYGYWLKYKLTNNSNIRNGS